MTTSLRDALTKLTCDLIRFQSTADKPDQVVAAMQYVENYVCNLPGLVMERSEAGGKPSVVATLRPTRQPRLILNGHLDVVAAPPALFTPEVRDGRIYGRGAQDMKGSVAVMLHLLKTLAMSGERPNVGFQFVPDEEIGGTHGTGRLLEEGWSCAFFIAGEPTDLNIVNEHKGGVWLRLDLPGEPTHASRPWTGQNPLFALADGLQRLRERFPPPTEDRWQTTCTPTRVDMHNSTNQVPPVAKLHVDIRRIPADDPHELVAAVAACFPTATVTINHMVSPLITAEEHTEVQRLMQTVQAVAGHSPITYREHFGTDARFYSAAGIPAVCIGPVGAGLHSDEEWVDIASLEQYYHILHQFVTQ